jgi:hypothetical protein
MKCPEILEIVRTQEQHLYAFDDGDFIRYYQRRNGTRIWFIWTEHFFVTSKNDKFY